MNNKGIGAIFCLISAILITVYYLTAAIFMSHVTSWNAGLFAADESHNIVYTFHNEKQNKDVYMVALRDKGKLIGYYEKHEYRNSETMKPYDLW